MFTVQEKTVIGACRRAAFFCAFALPLAAQYAGPAILSRGEAPNAVADAQITFRPYAEVRGSYDTGLSGVSINSSGQLTNSSSYGYSAVWGISGSHRWRHSAIGVDYSGTFANYAHETYFAHVDQSLFFSALHEFNSHLSATVSESVGTYSRDFGLGALQQGIGFDPATAMIPTTDYFDNRTTYFVTSGGLVYQRTRRLSFYFSGDFSLARRRSAALYGSNAQSAAGDVQYRLTRRSTIGARYQYLHFSFTGNASATDGHELAGVYSIGINRRLELSFIGGATRVETKFIEAQNVDPVIAAVLGTAVTRQIAHELLWLPTGGARLSRAYRKGIAYTEFAYRVTPGNGLFATSYSLHVIGGYNYTGLRRWTFGAFVTDDRSESAANVQGIYSSRSAWITLSRSLFNTGVHFIASYSARQYTSGDFTGYNRVINQAAIGLGFAPGAVPLRVW